jgi:hypothetical protein
VSPRGLIIKNDVVDEKLFVTIFFTAEKSLPPNFLNDPKLEYIAII